MLKISAFFAALLWAASAAAAPTQVVVRAQAQDAKFIGDHMGGVQVTLTDVRTGKVLAKGLTRGGAGDTARIMRAPRARGDRIADQAAGFEATLDLKEPTLVRADAVGPIGKPGAQISVSSSQWILPGGDIVGDGWVLLFPGLVVEPSAEETADGALQLKAQVSLMCGCPIEAGGLWDAANYAVTATVLRRGEAVVEIPLAFTGRTGEFAGVLPYSRSGRVKIHFAAGDKTTSNAGVATINTTVRLPEASRR